MKKIFVPVVALLFMAACHKKTVPTSTAATSDPIAEVKTKYNASQIAEGKIVFEGKCGKCHKLKQPGDFTVTRWEKILPVMSGKAKLSTDDAGKLRAWVITNAKS